MSNEKRKLLILDIDVTLAHATEQPLPQPADFHQAGNVHKVTVKTPKAR